jgi:cell division protein FtsB
MKATIQQQDKEIKTLLATITTLKDEIKEQRELTRSVAESARTPITQSFTK